VLANYQVTLVDAKLTITKAPLSIKADAQSKVYGDLNPDLTGTVTGIKNEDTVKGGFATEAGKATGVGTYPITAAAVGTAAVLANYDVTLVDAKLTITRAPLTVAAADKTKAYGDVNPDLTGTVTGVKNGDTVTGGYATAVNEKTGVGSYVITAKVGGTEEMLANYNVTLVNGTLRVTKAALTVTAADKTKVYGDANPLLTGTVAGVKNGDDVSGAYFTAADAKSGVADYTITAKAVGTDAVLANYAVTLVDAKLTITKAPLSVTAADKTKIVGAANPALTGTVTGIKNGDTVTGTYATSVTSTSPVGTYAIVAAAQGEAATLANYDITLVGGSLRVYYAWDGFLQPINDTAHQTGVAESKFKLGQTIPTKFVIKNSTGTVVQQLTKPTFTRSANLGSCDSNAAVDTAPTVTADAGSSYAWDGTQYQYNWSTKNLTAGEYRIYANLADGTARYVDICLTK
jgi:hypothetical protein